MPTERIVPIARRSSGLLRISLAFVVLASSIMLAGTSSAGRSMRPAQAAPLRAASDSELFGMVIRDPPDGGGSNPGDGSNHFVRVFTARAQAIAARYGTAISAYEIINEPNISFDLWVDSRSGSAEIKPERYAALITNAYRAIKSV